MSTVSSISELQKFIQDTAEDAVRRVFNLASTKWTFRNNWSATQLDKEFPVFQPVNVPAPMAPSAMTGGVDYRGIATWMEARTEEMYAKWFPQATSVVKALELWVLETLEAGTGLGAEAEAALFTQAKDRAYQAHSRSVQQTTNEMALRGYPLPPGAVAAARRDADRVAAEVLAAANREILVESMRMRADMVKTAVSVANDMYQSMRSAPIDLMKTYASLPALDADAKRAMANAMEAYYSSLIRYSELQTFDETKNFEVTQFKLNYGLERDKLVLQNKIAELDTHLRQSSSSISAMGDVAGAALSAQNSLLAVISQAEG